MAMSLQTIVEVVSWASASTEEHLPGLFYAIALDGVDEKSIPDNLEEVHDLLREMVRGFAVEVCGGYHDKIDDYAFDFAIALHEVLKARDKSTATYLRKKVKNKGVKS